MAGSNNLTLAVAGSRKTQSIVEECAAADKSARILVLTYTTVNQLELRSRLAQHAGDHPGIEVQGWFSFLIAHFVRPFVPFFFPGARVRGFDNDSFYQQGVRTDQKRRYFTSEGHVRKVHLAHLAYLVNEKSLGAPIERLEQLFDRIYIDETQDLNGYDLEVLKLLFDSGVDIRLVGDVRQATLTTSPQERKNSSYARMGVWKWFREQEQLGHLEIQQRNETYRCTAQVAALADSLFDSTWGFQPTVSLNEKLTGHDGVFLLHKADVESYLDSFQPLGLRVRKNVATDIPLTFMNFGEAKGIGRPHVVIVPTGAIADFLTKGKKLEDQQAASLYVAITRAEQSVAFILDNPGACQFEYWKPGG